MTERERWIVYPLLFLALGASLRDKLAKQTRSQQIVCEELFVVNDRGEPVARLAEGSLLLEGSGNTPGLLKVDSIQTNLLQTQNMVQRGKPVGEVVSWSRLLQLFQQLGLIRMAPMQAVPVVPQPLSETALPKLIAPEITTPETGKKGSAPTDSIKQASEVSDEATAKSETPSAE